MKKSIVLTSVLSILSISAFADITGSSNCTEGVLGTSANGSTANIDANWNPNTINIKWYNGDTQLTQTSCQYDTTIVLPTQPTKPGYTFTGWRLRTTPAAPNCSAITNGSTCDATNGCVWNHGTCYNSILASSSAYTSCSEITDESTCRSIAISDTTNNSESLDISDGGHLCIWSTEDNSCHLDYWYNFYGYLPSQSWCQEAIDGMGVCFWNAQYSECDCTD